MHTSTKVNFFKDALYVRRLKVTVSVPHMVESYKLVVTVMVALVIVIGLCHDYSALPPYCEVASTGHLLVGGG